ncbi:hypothetical protein GF351_02425 [Candidatus Woesearchaeota archaeon]|nr:hypothetical protein [Candidatus Woesearchaeota archaeon]
MQESIDNVKEELKRADHLIYVSLKYTRTVDIIRSIIDRLMNAFDHGIEALLRYAVEKGITDEIPSAPGKRINQVKELFQDVEGIEEFMDFYALLRRISRADFTRAREFRRHVTMTVELEGEKMDINIDLMHEYYEKTKAFLNLVENMVGEKKND